MDLNSMNPHRLTTTGRRTRPEPRYDLQPLLTITGHSWAAFGARVGLSRATSHRRLQKGITWTEADNYAIAFGLFPWEVWPEWSDADPTTWCDLEYDEDENDDIEVAA